MCYKTNLNGSYLDAIAPAVRAQNPHHVIVLDIYKSALHDLPEGRQYSLCARFNDAFRGSDKYAWGTLVGSAFDAFIIGQHPPAGWQEIVAHLLHRGATQIHTA